MSPCDRHGCTDLLHQGGADKDGNKIPFTLDLRKHDGITYKKDNMCTLDQDHLVCDTGGRSGVLLTSKFNTIVKSSETIRVKCDTGWSGFPGEDGGTLWCSKPGSVDPDWNSARIISEYNGKTWTNQMQADDSVQNARTQCVIRDPHTLACDTGPTQWSLGCVSPDKCVAYKNNTQDEIWPTTIHMCAENAHWKQDSIGYECKA